MPQSTTLKIPNPWWSPDPGYKYTALNLASKVVGPGKKAREYPSVFNVYWLLAGLHSASEHSYKDYYDAEGYWQAAKTLVSQQVDGCDLGDTTLVLQPRAFGTWLATQHTPAWDCCIFTKEKFIEKLLQSTAQA